MPLHIDAQKVLERLDEKVIGVEEQTRQLSEVFRRWRDTGKGDSCIVTGHKGSGRTTVVEKLLLAEDKKSKRVERNHLFIAQLGSDATAQSSVAGDPTIPRVVVIEDADELVVRQRQTLLYGFLDATRRNPWLVILMVNRQDFVSSLEKRVRSRLSTARIVFTAPLKFADYLEAFKMFLGCEEEISDEWEEFVEAFLKTSAVARDLRYMFQVSSSYGVLKACVSVFLGWLKANDSRPEEAVALWEAAVRSLCPSVSPVVTLLNNVSLRTFCVFLCVMRRLERAHPGSAVSYAKVVVDYKELCNKADSRMKVADDSVIYKELDQLVRMRVLYADTKTNNTAFRRVSLHADSFILSDAVKTRSIPSVINEWYKTIAVN